MSTPFPTINDSLPAEQGAEPTPKVPAQTRPPAPSSPGRVELPGKGPLLTRSGWSAFVIALIVICALERHRSD